MKIKKIICFSLLVALMQTMGACSMQSKSLPAENQQQSVSFAEKIALAPVNQPIVITGETPFGNDAAFLIEEPYASALGVMCRQANVVNTHQFFVVCNQKKSSQSKDNWVLMPSL